MKTEIRKIDSRLAATWLTQSKDNRPLRKSHVNYLAREMKEGRWRLTHQGIAFAPDGTLMDGQHRLQAIKEAAIPVYLQISYYEAGDNINFAFPILDRGLIRSISDITRIDTKIIQIYNVLLWLGVSKRRIAPDDYLTFDSKIGHTTRLFLSSCPYQRTYYTPAPVRAAGVMALYLKKAKLEHVSQLFAAWGTGNLSNSLPIVGAFMNYVPSLRSDGRAGNVDKFFASGIYCLLESNSNKSRIHLSQGIVDEYVKEAKETVDNLMQRVNIPKAELIAVKDAEINKLRKILVKKTALDIQAEQALLSKEAKD
jgi:hypothetical protein